LRQAIQRPDLNLSLRIIRVNNDTIQQILIAHIDLFLRILLKYSKNQPQGLIPKRGVGIPLNILNKLLNPDPLPGLPNQLPNNFTDGLPDGYLRIPQLLDDHAQEGREVLIVWV